MICELYLIQLLFFLKIMCTQSFLKETYHLIYFLFHQYVHEILFCLIQMTNIFKLVNKISPGKKIG